MRIELTNGYIIKSDKRQFILGIEKTDKDGNVSIPSPNYCTSLKNGMMNFVEKMVKESDAKSFAELAHVIIDAEETIRVACNGVMEMGQQPAVSLDESSGGVCNIDGNPVTDDDEGFDDL